MSTDECKYIVACYSRSKGDWCKSSEHIKCPTWTYYENYGIEALGIGAPMINPTKNLEDKVND